MDPTFRRQSSTSYDSGASADPFPFYRPRSTTESPLPDPTPKTLHNAIYQHALSFLIATLSMLLYVSALGGIFGLYYLLSSTSTPHPVAIPTGGIQKASFDSTAALHASGADASILASSLQASPDSALAALWPRIQVDEISYISASTAGDFGSHPELETPFLVLEKNLVQIEAFLARCASCTWRRSRRPSTARRTACARWS